MNQLLEGIESMKLEEVHECDLCGSDKRQFLFEGQDLMHDLPGRFSVQQCLSCQLYILNPRPGPNDIGRYYPPDYMAYEQEDERKVSRLTRLQDNYALEKRCRQIIARAGASGRLLDVGCATGVFLNGMKERGWEVLGLEPNPHAAQYARDNHGLDVREAYLEEANFPKDSFDVVTLWAVLEHVPSPEQTLREIIKILKPGGLVMLTVPNANAWERKLFGKYWAGWDVPRHFYTFSPDTLSRYLEESGFTDIEVVTFTGRHGFLVLNVQFLLTGLNVGAGVRNLILKLAASTPARMLTWPLFNVSDRLNRSSIMTTFGRKPSFSNHRTDFKGR